MNRNRRVTKGILEQSSLNFPGCVLQCSDIKTLFQRYLKRKDKRNGLLEKVYLLEEIDQYERILAQKNENEGMLIAKIVTIRDTYLLRGGKSEIQLDDAFRSHVLEKIEMLLSVDVARNDERLALFPAIFLRLYTNIVTQLRDDSFTRFTRSKKFIKYMCGQSRQFVDGIRLPDISQAEQQLLYNHSDFCEPYLLPKDFHCIRNLMNQSHLWKLLNHNEKRGHSSYISTCPYFRRINRRLDCVLTKFVFTVPYDALEIFTATNDPNVGVVTDSSLELQELLELIPPEGDRRLWSAVTMNKHNSVGAMRKARRFVATRTAFYDYGSDAYISVCKSCKHPKFPETPKEHQTKAFIIRVFQRVGQNVTLCTEITWSDLICWFSSNASTRSLYWRNKAKHQAKLAQQSVEEAIVWKKNGYELKDNGCYEALRHNMNLIPPFRLKDFV